MIQDHKYYIVDTSSLVQNTLSQYLSSLFPYFRSREFSRTSQDHYTMIYGVSVASDLAHPLVNVVVGIVVSMFYPNQYLGYYLYLVL